MSSSASISGIAKEAARAIESGDYKKWENLKAGLVDEGYPEEEVLRVFEEEGAGKELVPPDRNCHGNSMLFATKD